LENIFNHKEISMKKLICTGILTALLVLIGCASSGQAYGASTGSATASAEGFGGDVKVTVTLEKGKLVNVVVDGPHETNGIGSRAVTNMPAMMIEKKSIEVDIVSGATISSHAILEAARAAVAQIK
jgi:fumarate reductase flavoprotein subunit